MKVRLACFFVCLASACFADSHYVQQAQEALSNAQVFDSYDVPTAQDVLEVPVETSLPQSNMDEPALVEAGSIATVGDTTEAGTYATMSDNAVEWSVRSADQDALLTPDQVVTDPEAHMTENPFSTVGGSCTVTDFSSAPLFERTCQRTRDVYASSSTSTLNITVVRTEDYLCKTIGVGPDCGEMQTSGLCIETARACLLQDIDGNCIDEEATYTCSSDAPMAFAAPLTGLTTWGTPVETWSTTFAAGYSAQTCRPSAPTTCTSGPSVQTINGLLVTVDCTAQETVYECGGDTYSSTDCSAFEADVGCALIDSTCYLDTPDGGCGAYEDTYQCGSADNTDFDTSCDAVNVCVGDVCQSVPQETNSDLPMSMAAIGLLNSMAAEWDPGTGSLSIGSDGFEILNGELQFFNTTTNYCRVGILGLYNCCSNSGWALGVFTQCREHELNLVAAQQAGRAVYLTTFCRRRALFFCRERARRYCIYSGRIAREVSYQGQQQLHGFFECRALTYEEMENINWDEIDLTSVFGEMLANVDMASESELIDLIQANTSALAPQVVETYEEN